MNKLPATYKQDSLKPILGDSETEFKEHLLSKYENSEGMLEIVIKNGRPSQAIIALL